MDLLQCLIRKQVLVLHKDPLPTPLFDSYLLSIVMCKALYIDKVLGTSSWVDTSFTFGGRDKTEYDL